MKIRYLAAFTGCAAPFLSSDHSHAAYLGLSTQLHTTVSVTGLNGGLKSVYRVYAVFSNPDDYVTAIAGSPTLGTLTIKSLAIDGSPGGNFYNPAVGGNVAGSWSTPIIPFNALFDTYATIGLSTGSFISSELALTPGFPTFIAGNQLINDNLAWYTAGPQPQGYAGGPLAKPNTQVDFSSSTGLGILIMQLTVNAGNYVAGTVAVNVYTNGDYFTHTAQTFGAPIPAPATLAALALAAPLTPRRRRPTSAHPQTASN